ncbi:MAG: hypothetical protein IPI53_01030 [Saprospiraceae bacterium]|nr:hypothetical protein [Saprospiraceae bacterium]
MDKFLVLLFLCSLIGCSTGQLPYRWVGDITHDPGLDKTDFLLCHREKDVRQYFNMSQGMMFEGEKSAIVGFFDKNFKPVDIQESGWLRIRFIVNCKGQSGRFRMLESDENYKERPFDKKISGQIFFLTQQLSGWKILYDDKDAVDYYQYLIFKIKDGRIVKILP